jgi:hypothetical protein
MPPFEQAMRDWGAFFNTEPYWTTLHGWTWTSTSPPGGFPRDELVYKAFPSRRAPARAARSASCSRVAGAAA